MVKLPVIVYNHHDKTEVVNSALHLQRKLELLAIDQEKKGGRYIRPIVLFQAQPKIGEENITYEKLKRQLLSIGIPENQIKIKTATIDELKGEDLLSRTCEVRYIITINALKEGWDCPFAYVLASLADKSSAVDVEQILGRVLRQPYVMKHSASLLNISYVLTASVKFNDTLQSIVKGLQAAGFSDRDYREIDTMPEEEKQRTGADPLKQFLFPEQTTVETEQELDSKRISFETDNLTPLENDDIILQEIETMAEEQDAKLEAIIQQQKKRPADEQIFEEMGDKVKRYKITAAHKLYITDLKLPQFYLTVKQSDIFGTGKEFLSQEPLLHQFKLSSEDTKIDFEQISSDLYKVDIEETGKSEYDARFTKIEDMMVKEPVVAYILSTERQSDQRYSPPAYPNDRGYVSYCRSGNKSLHRAHIEFIKC
jgi:type III restriction enzyme